MSASLMLILSANNKLAVSGLSCLLYFELTFTLLQSFTDLARRTRCSLLLCVRPAAFISPPHTDRIG